MVLVLPCRLDAGASSLSGRASNAPTDRHAPNGRASPQQMEWQLDFTFTPALARPGAARQTKDHDKAPALLVR